MNEIARFDQFCLSAVVRIENAKTTDEVQKVIKEAKVLIAAARAAKNREYQEKGKEIQEMANRQLGMLMASQRDAGLMSRGGRPSKNRVGEKPGLKDAGIDKNLAHAARKAYPEGWAPKHDQARAAVRAKLEAGATVSRNEIAKEVGSGAGTVQRAFEYERGRLDGLAEAEARGATYTKAQVNHVEKLIKIRMRELEAEFEARVTDETKRRIDILFPDLEEMRRSAKLNEKYYRERLESVAIFTEAEYRDILLCTHEGNPSKETRQRAFIAFNVKKTQLTGKL